MHTLASGGGGRTCARRGRRIAWAIVGAASAMACASPTLRTVFRVAAAASLLHRAAPWLSAAATVVERLMEPQVSWHLWTIARAVPEEFMVGFRNAGLYAPVRTRVDGSRDRAPVTGATEAEDVRRLVHEAIHAEVDAECGICTAKLTPETLAIMCCCVPEAVGGRVHVTCARCWDALPEPKRCPHCRRRTERCSPAGMVRRIRGVV